MMGNFPYSLMSPKSLRFQAKVSEKKAEVVCVRRGWGVLHPLLTTCAGIKTRGRGNAE